MRSFVRPAISEYAAHLGFTFPDPDTLSLGEEAHPDLVRFHRFLADPVGCTPAAADPGDQARDALVHDAGQLLERRLRVFGQAADVIRSVPRDAVSGVDPRKQRWDSGLGEDLPKLVSVVFPIR